MGRGSRLRLALLFATAAAFLLMPASQAFAAEAAEWKGTLKVALSGSGTGEVVSGSEKESVLEYAGSPQIKCSYASPGPQTGICENQMTEKLVLGGGTEFLFPKPAAGSEVSGWTVSGGHIVSGCKLPNKTTCIIESNTEGEVVEVGVKFSAKDLKLNIEEGSGSVVSNPAGLSCSGLAPKSCEAYFQAGKKVTLTASPSPGYLFKSWKSCTKTTEGTGVNGRQCTIEITSETELKEVGVKFVKSWNLTTAKAGSGIGKYQTAPGGVLCLYNCGSAKAAFKEGNVTIKEAPAKHNHFVQWLGDCTGSSPECTLNMNEDHSVEAEFAPDTQYSLSLSKTGGGQASIKSSPSGVLCGYTCGSQSASFYEGETVTLTATLNKGTTKITWGGACFGSALTCEVTMSEATSVTAKLD